MESAWAVGFRSSCFSTVAVAVAVASCRPSWNFSTCDDLHGPSRSRATHRRGFSSDVEALGNASRFPRPYSFTTRKNQTNYKNNGGSTDLSSLRVRAVPNYHPFEEIRDTDPEVGDVQNPARLSDAEMTRTIIEVNSTAILMFSGVISDEGPESIFWPDLPYITDEHGDIYFEVRNDEDIVQTLTVDNNYVQVIIGMDNLDMMTELELSGTSDIDFGIEEITDEELDSDSDDLSDEDWVAIHEDKEDGFDSSETLGDWANLETMRYSHPMYFANIMSEAVSGLHLDLMDQPSTGLAIQGLLRPALTEEQSIVRKHVTGSQVHNNYAIRVEQEPGIQISSEDHALKGERLQSGTALYKLEIIDIHLVSAYGNQTMVDMKDFRKARPDIIAHAAAKFISRLKAGGERTIQALKSFCLRYKGIQVEEVAVIGVDSLGFDMRICVGGQVQTIRSAFSTRATSEHNAERQLEDLLFPGLSQKLQPRQELQQPEC